MSNTRKPRPHPRPSPGSGGGLRADATGTPVSVTVRGHTFTVPPAAEWDVDVIPAATKDMDLGRAVRLLLGEAQYERFAAKCGRSIRVHAELINAAGSVAGVGDLGESLTSAPS